jgi:peptidoglycan/LPS O-acetylase OafA/YrhL
LDVGLNLIFLGELGQWINGSFWSIAVEVKFYLLVGVLAAFVGRGARFVNIFTGFTLAMIALWAVSSLVSPTGQRITAESVFELITIAPCLPFFAFGILARCRQTGDKSMRGLLSVMALAMAFVLSRHCVGTPDDFISGSLPLIGTLSVFFALIWLFVRFVDGHHLPQVPVISAAVASIGFVSYSWYLLHETLGFSIMAALGAHVPSGVTLLVAIVGTYAIAWLFAQGVEWRFRKQFDALALWIMNQLALVLPIKLRNQFAE